MEFNLFSSQGITNCFFGLSSTEYFFPFDAVCIGEIPLLVLSYCNKFV